MNKPLQIIHLSDIHCDATHKWDDVFSQVTLFIKKQAEWGDTLIVITGDLVDSPNKKNYKTLLDCLAFINEPPYLGIVCVPGNHDLFRYGNRILSPFKSAISKTSISLYSEFARKLAKRFEASKNSRDSEDEKTIGVFSRVGTWFARCINRNGDGEKITRLFSLIRVRLLQEYGIALYLFNSTECNNRLFAEGYVSAEQISENEKLLTIENGKLARPRKIALLHHHPLSLHSGKPGLKEALQNATLELTNKFSFFNLLADNKFDLVLHGHTHKSMKYSIDPILVPDGHLLSVSGCGSSSATAEDRKLEIRVYTFSSFEATGQSYASEPRNTFALDGANFQLICPAQSRRRNATNGYIGACNYTSNDLIATSKTKELLILESGRVSAEIVLSGISSQKNSRGAIALREIISADTGRVFSALSVCDNGRVAFQSPQADWRPLALNRTRGMGPCTNEYVELDVFEEDVTNADTLRIQYHQRSGFALDSNAYDELYHHPKGDEAKRAEYCLIYSQIPVSSLELCITFPEGKFPSPNSFTIKVVERNDTRGAVNGSQELSHLASHLDEERFLSSSNNCLRVWPLSRTVSLSIPYPQPNLIYAIQWEVPKGVQIGLNRAADKLLDYFSKDRHRPNRKDKIQKKNLFKAVEEGVKSTFGKDVKMFVFAPTEKSNRKMLELIYGSDMKLDDGERPTMLRGRGIAGTAYIHHRNVYYNKQFRLADNPHVEEIITGLAPLAVIGLPITYSLFDIQTTNIGNSKTIFVITIVAESETSEIYTNGVKAISQEAEPDVEAIGKMFQKATDMVSSILIAKMVSTQSEHPIKPRRSARKSSIRSQSINT